MVVGHELAHIHLQAIFPPPWLGEGMASFVAAHVDEGLHELASTISSRLDAAGLPAFLDCLGDRSSHERIEASVGLLYLTEVYELAGIEAVSNMARAMRAHHFITADAIAKLRSYVPEQRKFDFDALTAKRFRNLGRYCPALSPD
jgi:hypothetical protein